ncbi:hypothetical protein FALBO_14129 [Fusarium albosuccineum]|uniref:Uncharacterized protein n=1 Tax=Fusarium albosuccineum TaxID=1237068 RepID=A0A8H4P7L1_9HYPO|nr:hypothetical protein FALBO_14129 [Fusarium albosuccineum]
MWCDSDPHNTLDGTVDGKFELWENEAIQCVHRYVQDLYGAVFAHSVGSWLPEIPDTLLTETSEKIVDDGLLFPENVRFCPNAYSEDMNGPTNLILNPRSLAHFGFDMITRLLMLPRDETGCPLGLVPWLNAIGRRQRSWVFFDDARHYPRQDISRHFPTQKQLEQQKGPCQFFLFASDPSAARRRSWTWHDERIELFTANPDRNSEMDQEFELGNINEAYLVTFFTQL